MPPNNYNEEVSPLPEIPAHDMKTAEDFKPKYLKSNILLYVYVHLTSLYGLYLLPDAKWGTIVLAIFLYNVGVVGLSAGKHRYWSHRAFKAKLPLQILMAVMTSVDFQFSIVTWVRDHRAHHKFSDTHADPYNPKRGVFFAHAGWLLQSKHPEVKRRGRGIDITDVTSDPVASFQHRHYALCGGLACFIIPTILPLVWGESLGNSWHINVLRYVLSMNAVGLINSYTHKYGFRPYEVNMTASQNIAVSALTSGEGFHNYHHVFPSDYRSSELGQFSLATTFIEFFEGIGWAYDLKTTSEDMVRARQARTGDGTDMWGKPLLEKNICD